MISRTVGEQSIEMIWRCGVLCASLNEELNIVRKNSDRMSIALWHGKRTDLRGLLRVREGDLEAADSGPMGMPSALDVGFASCSKAPFSSSPPFSSSSSSARKSTSANMPLSRSHFTSSALLVSVTTLCLSTFSWNHKSSWSRPFSTSSALLCRANLLSAPSSINCDKLCISRCLLILSTPARISESVKPVPGPPPTSFGNSPRYKYLIAIPNDCGGNEPSLQIVVSGAAASFCRKYGDRAERMNLWRWNTSSNVETAMSAV